ncbi:hypothetical protein KBZ15_08085 [Cyanobium sp. BA20m-p-22]|uniref:hypothetical protein n=1 Tax=Cyanobium sp. BA20m-p-22 TaxID=2823704 RepID=UPI0020CD7406|nr:hypothetical protein [Cyanobium sp. BA20m-p-22]MCP9909862.1 hypothetical protein [Cyanobium sp. BA20m-p-22]
MIQCTTLHCSDHAYCFRILELLCEEASAHLPAPLERLEQLCADLLFERQVATPASVPVWCPESELPF